MSWIRDIWHRGAVTLVAENENAPSCSAQDAQARVAQLEGVRFASQVRTLATGAALAASIDPDERTVLIEDTSEIQMQARNLVRLEARREEPPAPAVTLRDLLRTTLRLRDDNAARKSSKSR